MDSSAFGISNTMSPTTAKYTPKRTTDLETTFGLCSKFVGQSTIQSSHAHMQRGPRQSAHRSDLVIRPNQYAKNGPAPFGTLETLHFHTGIEENGRAACTVDQGHVVEHVGVSPHRLVDVESP